MLVLTSSRVLVIGGLLVLAILGVLGWGYSQVAARAYVYVWLSDDALRDRHTAYGRVANADLRFQDAEGRTVATARSTDGVVLFSHPQVGDCTHTRNQDPSEWRRCFDVQSRWFMSWARQVTHASVSLPACTIDRVPVSREEYRGRWWLWWIPLPHMDNSPLTYFTFNLRINSDAACRGRGL